MNKTQVKGTINEMMGKAKRKAGEMTGNKTLQVKGIVQQAQGKIENTIGKAAEAVGDVVKETEVHMNAHVKLASRNSSVGANVTTTNSSPNSRPSIRTT